MSETYQKLIATWCKVRTKGRGISRHFLFEMSHAAPKFSTTPAEKSYFYLLLFLVPRDERLSWTKFAHRFDMNETEWKGNNKVRINYKQEPGVFHAARAFSSCLFPSSLSTEPLVLYL